MEAARVPITLFIRNNDGGRHKWKRGPATAYLLELNDISSIAPHLGLPFGCEFP